MRMSREQEIHGALIAEIHHVQREVYLGTLGGQRHLDILN
jgi:hypothetical protein